MNFGDESRGASPVVSTAVNPAIAMQLLSAMLGAQAHPIDRLAAHCAGSRGMEWSGEIFGQHPELPTTLDGWIARKSVAKAAIIERDLHAGDPRALGAFLVYVSAIAGALAFHGQWITSGSPAEIRRGLPLLGPFLEPTWSNIFARAVERLTQMDSEQK